MPRIHISMQNIEAIESLEDQENWEELIGLRSSHVRRDALHHSVEMRERRRSARGSREALDRKRSERRKQVYRGGRQ